MYWSNLIIIHKFRSYFLIELDSKWYPGGISFRRYKNIYQNRSKSLTELIQWKHTFIILSSLFHSFEYKFLKVIFHFFISSKSQYGVINFCVFCLLRHQFRTIYRVISKILAFIKWFPKSKLKWLKIKGFVHFLQNTKLTI